MPVPLLLAPEAEMDLGSARAWYDGQRAGLGAEFLAEVARVFRSIEQQPEQFPLIHRNTRRALVRRFPFGVFCVSEEAGSLITAVLHARRDPITWVNR